MYLFPSLQILKLIITVLIISIIGYDPVFADPFQPGGDPGIKKQIFLPTKAAEDGTTRFDMQNFILAQDDLR